MDNINSLCLCVLVLCLLFECGHFDSLARIDSRDHLLQKNIKGETVSYRVHLPVVSPKLVTEKDVNNDTICTTPAEKIIPNKVISRPRLRRTTSNVVGGGSPAYKRFRRQPQLPANHYATLFAQYIKKHSVGEKVPVERISLHSGTSNSDSLPFFADNNSRPFAPKSTTEYPKPVRKTSSPEHNFSNNLTTHECGVVAGEENRVPLIHNGLSYDRGDIPWLVAIYLITQNSLQFICAGTLVTDLHVVTAAHCMSSTKGRTPITQFVIKIGAHSLNDWTDDITVTRKLMAATIHEEYQPATLKYDILILTLNKRVKFNRYIRPACLWSGNTELLRVVGSIGVVAGWGSRGMGSLAEQDDPQKVHVPIVSTKECRASKSDFHKLTYDKTLCAGGRNGAGPCNGDSGGGLYLLDGGKWRLRGIVSVSTQNENGGNICNLNEYIVYTDTAQFLPWIINILSV